MLDVPAWLNSLLKHNRFFTDQIDYHKFITAIRFPWQPNIVSNNVFTPLTMAFYGCSLKCMKLLVEVQLLCDSQLLGAHVCQQSLLELPLFSIL
jgi:hypothetical protein